MKSENANNIAMAFIAKLKANITSIIEIASYTSKEKREQEKEAFEKGEFIDVFKETKFIEKEYEEDLNVVSAYEYLKTLPEFSGCADD